ncbi:hypothetical protein DEO72_LG3g1568 [Vigna unguiculata]|uniref:Uncharacterized protein n=1 Tax=Vigna unguiculata TaxID=3917 RepID=A0A4D6LEN9_VIGUN|nr:hypothetical protein DEO72_LG3g1568 [Vigna unguiculata]
MAKRWNHHSLVDHENFARLLPSTKSMIIARKNSHIHHNHATKQASCYSHHRSQSALSETNWPLRVSGCSPYLESLPSYTDGAPPWAPTNRGHGITSRPLKRDPRGFGNNPLLSSVLPSSSAANRPRGSSTFVVRVRAFY